MSSKGFLEEKKLLMPAGSILEATIIHAPSSTYGGIKESGAQLFSLFALANLYQVRKHLLTGSG
ncbi:MAG: hypothetical protein KUG52_07095 [Immundisolibacteraceae bacterium]|nr:hypothetical protein [Immundisolibacteraceae bacterium]